jgi:3-methyladenine DNA glycosylase AlkD
MAALTQIRADITASAQPDKAVFFPTFFKAGEGQYGEGDQFLGITVPHCRIIATRHYKGFSFADTKQLLASPWHEERLIALLILVLQFAKAGEAQRQEIFTFYLNNTDRINNWDLVDASAYKIVGHYAYDNPAQQTVLATLARSASLWERRIAIVSTFYFLQQGDPAPTLRIAETLLPDSHDLIQKANGWMLRELGKRVDTALLITFLKKHYHTIPRTTLRYAIERFEPAIRTRYLAGDF